MFNLAKVTRNLQQTYSASSSAYNESYSGEEQGIVHGSSLSDQVLILQRSHAKLLMKFHALFKSISKKLHHLSVLSLAGFVTA